ncbi:MAG: helix-turn-helix domain-containing protein [Candidatus Gastranaerophilales bacterium]|nr:helix-turn-helix domain-containing protein [Candidatus Gastranaerophilales bacterium]
MQTLLDVTQLAQMLKIEVSTIYDWVHKKKIKYIKIGRLLRFRQEDIEALIQSNTYEKEYVR